MHDYLKTIKLGPGKGEPGKRACWMTALSSHLGQEWTDRCECVDYTINSLCIAINDLYEYDNETRTEDIMEFGLFAPLGTWSKEDEEKRRLYVINAIYKKWLPCTIDCAFQKIGIIGMADELRSVADLQKVSKIYEFVKKIEIAIVKIRNNALAQKKVSYDRFWAEIVLLLDSAWGTVINLTMDIKNIIFSNVGNMRIFFKTITKHEVNWAAPITTICSLNRSFIKNHLFPTLKELIEMGPHAPEEPAYPACGVPKFLELVGAN